MKNIYAGKTLREILSDYEIQDFLKDPAHFDDLLDGGIEKYAMDDFGNSSYLVGEFIYHFVAAYGAFSEEANPVSIARNFKNAEIE